VASPSGAALKGFLHLSGRNILLGVFYLKKHFEEKATSQKII
jgi:hypothetical protein